MKTGRNDLCPCGSGRKYKQCCLAREDAARAATKGDRGTGMALSWLDQRFRRQTVSAIDGGFFAAFAAEEVRDALAKLGPHNHEMLQVNIADYLLSEAIYDRGDEERRGIDWVLESGPSLRPEQREFLEAVAAAPLRLYEVESVRHGEGLTLRDVLDPARSPPFVTEHSASTRLIAGDMLGVRILRLPARHEIGGAVYLFDRIVATDLIAQMRREPDPELADDAAVAAGIEDDVLAATIRDSWLESLLFPQIPELVDRTRGAPVLLVDPSS